MLPVLVVPAILLYSLCPPAEPPLPGPVVRAFAPVGSFEGHWGVDLAGPAGSPVQVVAPGRVSFAGSVAGRLTVTVNHGGGVRTSYSYLSGLNVGSGALVGEGDVVGLSGEDRGVEGVHLSLRVGERYLDPMRWLSCRLGDPGSGTRLVSSPPDLCSGSCAEGYWAAPSIRHI
jgi:murein DD-endopeptidase MepM/ murein hydrolase activator NlpD